MICPPVEAGTPDLLACVNGFFVGIEVKFGRGKTSKIQDHRISEIRSAFGVAEVIRDREGFLLLLSRLESKKPSEALSTSTKPSSD